MSIEKIAQENWETRIVALEHRVLCRDGNTYRTVANCGFGTNDELRANLIASAPALYRACKGMLATFTGYAEGSIGGQALSKVEAAIASAEGKESQQ